MCIRDRYRIAPDFSSHQLKASPVLHISTNLNSSPQSFTGDQISPTNKKISINDSTRQDKGNSCTTTSSPSQKRSNVLLPHVRKHSSPSLLSFSKNSGSHMGDPNQLSTPPTPKSAGHTMELHSSFNGKHSSSSTSSLFALESLKTQNRRSSNSSNHSSQYRRHTNPVSYTHLDVYKRQVLMCRCKRSRLTKECLQTWHWKGFTPA